MKRHCLMNKLAGAALLLALLVVPAAQAATVVIAEGYGDDRGQALQDARRTAVAMVVGEHLSSRSLVENFALVSDRIFSSTTGYVSDFEVLQEGMQDGVYRVRIRATIDRETALVDVNAIKVLSAARGNPRFVVIPDPGMRNSDLPDEAIHSAARGIQEYFVEHGFEVVHAPDQNIQASLNDPTTFERVSAWTDRDPAQTGMNTPAALANLSQWGAGVGAEYVIYYSVYKADERAGNVFKRATADVELHAVHTGSYRVVAEAEGRGLGGDRHEEFSARKAAREAGRNASAEAAEDILSDWTRDGTVSGNRMTLIVSGLGGDEIGTLANDLENTGAVRQAEMKQSNADGTSLMITLDGAAYELADAFESIADEKNWHYALVGASGSALHYVIVLN